ncbi:MAG: helix-turn-helix domain-containing protein [Actinobacteria bacterium]|nr:helix-turn-helix domain-containing protein [Actinomycetota bacterium]
MRAPDTPDGVLTLGALLGRLSPVVLELLASPLGTDVEVRRVLIAGSRDEVAVGQGDVVLLVGADPAGVETAECMARAAAARAAAVVLKAGPAHEPVVTSLAGAHGVAVVTAPPSADWGQVFTLLRTVVSAAGVAGHDVDHAPADLFALANAIAGAVGGATTIEDRQLRVVAYSNLDQPIDAVRRDSILGRSVPGYVMERDDIVATYRRMWANTDVVRLPGGDDGRVRPRMGASVRAGGEVIGTIWVVEGDRSFDAAAERALRDSTPVAALHLLHHQAADDVERRRRSDAVRAALDGRRGDGHDVLAGSRAMVVAFGIRDLGGDVAAAVVRQRRLLDLVTYQAEMFDARSAAVSIGDVVLVILPETAPAGSGSRRQRELVMDVAQRASHALKVTVCAGVGSVIDDVGGSSVVASRWEAEQALGAVLAAGPTEATVRSIDEVRSSVVMRRVRDVLVDDARCRTPHLEVLARHDAEQHTDHLATLGAYLDSFGDVSSAAAALSVHPNTLRYRLKRIVDLLGVDLTDPVERFVLELQWRLR